MPRTLFKNIDIAEFLVIKPEKIKAIRASYGLSQSKFATLLKISVRTLQNWEIGHRTPCGPACALLDIADKNPNAFLKKLSSRMKREIFGDLALPN